MYSTAALVQLKLPTYNDETGQALCKECTGGRYSSTSEPGQTTPCKGAGCSAGTFSSEIGILTPTKCKFCRAGTYSNEIGRASCEGKCIAGTFSSEIGQTTAATCLRCAGGQYSSETGIAECKSCTIGTYSSELGKTTSATCKRCQATTFNDEIGQLSCKSCPQGWSTTNRGSILCTRDIAANPLLVPLLVTISFIAVLGGVFAIYCFRQNKKKHDVELGERLYEQEEKNQEINQRLLESATNPLEQDQFTILPEDLNLGPRIGAGGCGLIYKATLGANTVVAAKEIITAMMNPKDLKEFIHEARMLTQMNHPQVLRVLGFCTVLAEDSMDDMEHKYIVTEFAPNGTLENAIEDAIAVAKIIKETNSKVIKMPFTKIQALEWALQIASGMTFCHRRGFIHRDLKPQNILLNKSNDALVADLGTVRNTGSGKNPDGTSPAGMTIISLFMIAVVLILRCCISAPIDSSAETRAHDDAVMRMAIRLSAGHRQHSTPLSLIPISLVPHLHKTARLAVKNEATDLFQYISSTLKVSVALGTVAALLALPAFLLAHSPI